MLFDDIFNVILNIWNRIKTIWQFKFIIPCWSYYFKVIVLILFSYIVRRVIDRYVLKATCLFEFFKSNICDKLRTNLCGSLIFQFPMLMIIVSMLIFHNSCFISFLIWLLMSWPILSWWCKRYGICLIFSFLIYINFLQLLFVLIILEV